MPLSIRFYRAQDRAAFHQRDDCPAGIPVLRVFRKMYVSFHGCKRNCAGIDIRFALSHSQRETVRLLCPFVGNGKRAVSLCGKRHAFGQDDANAVCAFAYVVKCIFALQVGLRIPQYCTGLSVEQHHGCRWDSRFLFSHSSVISGIIPDSPADHAYRHDAYIHAGHIGTRFNGEPLCRRFTGIFLRNAAHPRLSRRLLGKRIALFQRHMQFGIARHDMIKPVVPVVIDSRPAHQSRITAGEHTQFHDRRRLRVVGFGILSVAVAVDVHPDAAGYCRGEHRTNLHRIKMFSHCQFAEIHRLLAGIAPCSNGLAAIQRKHIPIPERHLQSVFSRSNGTEGKLAVCARSCAVNLLAGPIQQCHRYAAHPFLAIIHSSVVVRINPGKARDGSLQLQTVSHMVQRTAAVQAEFG